MFRILPPAFTEAIGWTLLHSLWQGALIVLVLGILMAMINRRSAQVRYLAATAALFLVFVAAAVTFCTLYFSGGRQPADASQPLPQPVVLQVATPHSPDTQIAPPNPAFSETVSQYVGQHSPLIVLAWMAGMLVLMLRFAGGLVYVQRMKRHQTVVVPQDWQIKASVLSRKIGLRRSVQVFESALVRVPVAIGYLKPVVLMPVGTFTGLPPQQIEAILAHELAHIARNDYWINILQSLVEILFFYHPAVWWMSGVVRREREHCCDDITVQTCGDNLAFVQALARLGAMQSGAMRAAPRLTLAASGGSLLRRVQRLLQATPQKSTFGGSVMASAILLLCLLAVSASAVSGLGVSSPAQDTPQNSISRKGQTPAPDRSTYHSTFTDTNKVVRELVIVKNRKGKVIEVSIDGKKLSGAELKNYHPAVAQKLKEIEGDAENERTGKRKETRKNGIRANEETTGDTETDADVETETETITDIRVGTDIEMPMPPLAMIPPPAPPTINPPLAPMPPMAPFMFDFENLEEWETLDGQLEETGSQKKPGAKTPANLDKLKKEMRELLREQNRLQLEIQAERMNLYEEQMRAYETDMGKLERDIRGSGLKQGYVFKYPRPDPLPMKIERLRVEADKKREMAARNHEKALRSQSKALEMQGKVMKENEKSVHDMKRISAELQKDGFAREGRPFEFKINDAEMLIDGKKQPLSVYEKYRKLLEQELEQKVKLGDLKDGQWFILQSDGKGGSSMQWKSSYSQKPRAEQTPKESAVRKNRLFVEFYNFDSLTKKKPLADGC